MITVLRHKIVFIICAVMFASFSSAQAQQTASVWIGQPGGSWSDSNNWQPAVVPNNSGSQLFNVSIDERGEYPGVSLDIDVVLSSLALTEEYSTVFLADHNLSSISTSVGVNFPNEVFGGGGIVYAFAQNNNVVADLGNLSDFAGTTLQTGQYVADSSSAAPGVGATIRFNGADIRSLNAYLALYGSNSHYTDQNGNDALAHLQSIQMPGFLDLGPSTNFTTSGALTNAGFIFLMNDRLTVGGDYTGIGYPLDPDTIGIVIQLAPGPDGDSTMVINGRLTNYDASKKILGKMWTYWEAANGRSATIQVLGGNKPLDIVTSNAALQLYGPNTGFRDKYGNDALRNLAVSARLSIGDRDFTTANNFTSTSRLSIYGNTHFNVNGQLIIQSGLFEISAETSYTHAGDGFLPDAPPYGPSTTAVKGNFGLAAGTTLRCVIFDNQAVSTVKAGGAAILNGALDVRLFNDSQVNSADTYTLISASKITGRFSNVASGERIAATLNGAEVGSFKLTITKTAVVLSDFQAAP